ncbi:hypothetical protein J4447_05040 [Candidatus Pacearchaeota archaeon]|nr:hypothetical protein [Candidatus Aenigmarchaeota archaeon]MBS3074785.1 hypothetical protein [Candidatus Pacearchaeota archaeon]
MEEKLESLNLTEIESRMFDKILKRGGCKPGIIVKELGLHKGTVYNSLRRLEEKGLIGYTKVDGIKKYFINKLAIEKILSEKKESLEKNIKEVSKILKIAQESIDKKEEANVEVLVGVNSYKTFHSHLYEWAHTTKKEYYEICPLRRYVEMIGEDYIIREQARKKKLKIRCKILIDEDEKYIDTAKHLSGEIRYLKSKSHKPTGIWIYGDSVALVLWGSKPPLTIIISSKETAESFMNYFEELWNIASGPKLLFPSRHKINLYDFIKKSKKCLDIFDIVGAEMIHEGRGKIIELIKATKKVRILIANPNSEAFKKRVFLEERYIKSITESRMLFEWKAAITNLKDIIARTKKEGLLEIRLYDGPFKSTKIIVNNNEMVYNSYNIKKGEYGSSSPSIILNREFNREEFDRLKQEFEELWNMSKRIDIEKSLEEEKDHYATTDERVSRFVNVLSEKIKHYIGKDKACLLAMFPSGTFFAIALRRYLLSKGKNVSYAELNRSDIQIKKEDVWGKKVIVVDSSIYTGTTYRMIMNKIRPLKRKYHIKGIKYAVEYDMINLSDFSSKKEKPFDGEYSPTKRWKDRALKERAKILNKNQS